jgi:hypothetical protein
VPSERLPEIAFSRTPGVCRRSRRLCGFLIMKMQFSPFLVIDGNVSLAFAFIRKSCIFSLVYVDRGQMRGSGWARRRRRQRRMQSLFPVSKRAGQELRFLMTACMISPGFYWLVLSSFPRIAFVLSLGLMSERAFCPSLDQFIAPDTTINHASLSLPHSCGL